MEQAGRQVLRKPRGAIDSIEVGRDRAVLRGWALTAGDASPETFAVRLDDRPAQILALERIDRADVRRIFPQAAPRCGFRLTVAWPADLDPATARPRVTVAPVSPAPSAPLSVGDGLRWGVLPEPKAPGVPSLPSMPPEARAVLAEGLGGVAAYLEYGSGGSTMMALDHGAPAMVSVESDGAWLAAVRAKAGARLDPARHHLLHVDIGPTKSLGYPVSDAHWRRYRAYPLAPWDLCRERGIVPDLVLIDGRFRLACFFATLIHARPRARILFDDYAERPYYHAAGSLVPPLRSVGRLAEFAVPAGLDRDAAWRGLVEALADSR